MPVLPGGTQGREMLNASLPAPPDVPAALSASRVCSVHAFRLLFFFPPPSVALYKDPNPITLFQGQKLAEWGQQSVTARLQRGSPCCSHRGGKGSVRRWQLASALCV